MEMKEIVSGDFWFDKDECAFFIDFVDDNGDECVKDLIYFIIDFLKNDNSCIGEEREVKFNFDDSFMLCGKVKLAGIFGLLFYHNRNWYGWQEIDDSLINYFEIEMSKSCYHKYHVIISLQLN